MGEYIAANKLQGGKKECGTTLHVHVRPYTCHGVLLIIICISIELVNYKMALHVPSIGLYIFVTRSNVIMKLPRSARTTPNIPKRSSSKWTAAYSFHNNERSRTKATVKKAINHIHHTCICNKGASHNCLLFYPIHTTNFCCPKTCALNSCHQKKN